MAFSCHWLWVRYDINCQLEVCMNSGMTNLHWPLTHTHTNTRNKFLQPWRSMYEFRNDKILMTKFDQLEVCMKEFKNDNFMTKFRQLEVCMYEWIQEWQIFMTTTHMEQVSSTRKKYVSIQEGQSFVTKFHQLEEVCINSRMTNFHDHYPHGTSFIN
jgi:hypothetical protein